MARKSKLRILTWEEMKSMLTVEGRFVISGLRGAEAVVLFENRQAGSPEEGTRLALAVGKDRTHKTVAEFDGAWMGEGASRKDAVAYCIYHNPTNRN